MAIFPIPSHRPGPVFSGELLQEQSEHFYKVAAALAHNILATRGAVQVHTSDQDAELAVNAGDGVLLDDELAELQRLQLANSCAEQHPAVRMWHGVDALPNSSNLYGEIMRLAKLGMTLVGTSVIDERAFSSMTFVKNCLRASLTTHLPVCVRMKLQEEYDLDSFPYHLL